MVVQRKRTPALVAVALDDVSVSSLFWESAWRVLNPAERVGGLLVEAIANAKLARTTARETDNASRRRARLKRGEQHIIGAEL